MSLIRIRRHAAPLSLVVLIPFLAMFFPPRRASADDVIPPIATGTGGGGALAGPTPAPNSPEALATADLSTGAAHSVYPFRLNTARGGAQPSLALVYDSSAGTGFAGPGWTLDLPSIVRTGKAARPRFNDSVFGPQSSLAADALADDYMVDGELLVPLCVLSVGGISATCTNGAASTETLPAQFQGTSTTGWVYFRREIDDGARYFLSKDGRTWAKQTKSGHLVQYGHPLDGLYTDGLEQVDSNTLNMMASNAAPNIEPNPTFRWDIVRDTDASNNSVYYSWTNLSTQLPNIGTINPGVLYLSDIYDTPALNIFAHHVHLSWVPSFAAQSPFLLDPIWRARPSALLLTVDVTSAPQSGTTRNLVRRYNLQYQTIGTRQFLRTITLEGAPPLAPTAPSSCGYTPIAEGNDGTLPATTGCRTMPATTYGYSADFVTGGAISLTKDSAKTAALAGIGTTIVPYITPLQLVDVNGDGAADVVTADPSDPKAIDVRYSGDSTVHKLVLSPNNGYIQSSGGVVELLPQVTNLGWITNISSRFPPAPTMLGDWMGNGLVNWLYLDPTSPTSTGTEVYSVSTYGPSGTSLWVWANGSPPPSPPNAPNWPSAGYSGGFQGVNQNAMDVDGDGLTDLTFVPDSSGGALRTYFTARDRNGKTVPFGLASNSLCATPSMQATGTDTFETMADMDGDGLADMVIVSKDSNYSSNHIVDFSTLLNRGDGRFGAPGAHVGSCDGTYGYPDVVPVNLGAVFASSLIPDELDHTSTRFGDLNGDGFADLVMMTSNGMEVCLGQGGSRGLSNLVCTSKSATDLGWPSGATVPLPSTSLALGDMDASGMQDIVVLPPQQSGSAPPTVWSLSQNSTHPGLLTSITSGTGVQTTITYQSARQQGITLQVPSWTVHSISTSNSLTGSQAVSLTHTYQYETPVYDVRERAFVGFQQVVDNFSGPAMPAGTQQTTTTFATAACTPTIYQTDSCATGPDYSSYRGLRGLPVSVVQSAAAGNLRTKWNEYRWYPIYSGMDGRVVVQRTLNQDHDYILNPSQASPSTNVYFLDTYSGGAFSKGQGPTVSVPIQSTSEIRHQYNFDFFGNLSSTLDYGYVTGGDQIIATLNQWQLPPGDATGWNYRVFDSKTFEQDPSLTSLGPVAGTNVREYQYAHDSSGRVTDEAGILTGSLSLPGPDGTPGSRPAAQPAALPGIIHVRSIQYDSLGNVSKVTEPNPDGSAGGACTIVTYDTTFDQLPVLVATYANGCSDPNPPLQVERTFDRGLEEVTQRSFLHASTAPPEIERRDYDAFGRIADIYRQNPNPSQIGVTESSPAFRAQYTDNTSIRQVHTTTMDGPTATPYFVDHYRFIDAFGDTLASADQSGPTGTTSGAQYTISGFHTRYSTGAVQNVALPLGPITNPSTFNPDGIGAPGSTRSFGYDGLGRLTSSTDFMNHTTTYGQNVSSVYITDPEQATGGLHAGAFTLLIHDGHGRTISTQKHFVDGATSDLFTGITYQATGEPRTITRSGNGQPGTPGGSVTRSMRYDTLGRMVQNVEPNTSTTIAPSGTLMAWTYAYDALGRLVGTSDARGCGENLFHDNFGRLIAEDYSPCTSSQAPYGLPPNLVSGDNTEAFYVYDAWNRILTERDLAQESTYTYDTRDRVTGVVRQIATPTPSPTLNSRYAPNLFGKNWSYSEADRPLSTSHGNNSSFVSATYTFDGHIQSVNSGDGVLLSNQVFDLSGRPTQQVFGDAAATTVTMGYDANERLTNYAVSRAVGPWLTKSGYTPPGGPAPYALESDLTTLTIGYDGVGNPMTETDTTKSTFSPPWPNGSAPKSRAMHYWSDYRLLSVDTTYANPNGSDGFVSPYQPEANKGDPTYPQPTPVGTRPAHQSFTYDWDGNLSASTDDLSDFYDRSIGAATSGGTPSAQGPDQFSGATGSPGQVTAAYDGAGNLGSLKVTRPGGQSNYGYSWDELGRVASAGRTDLATGFQVIDTFSYAADGHRVRTTRTSTTKPTPVHTLEVFDSLVDKNAITVGTAYEDDSTTEQVYLGIGGMTLGHLMTDPSDPNGPQHVFMTIGDPLGSSSYVIDHDTGELVEAPSYLPYGGADTDYRDASRWDAFREDVRYTGHWDNAEVGLIYFGARYYNPQLGRWISPDPLAIHGLRGDANPYAFAGGSPLGRVDVMGADWFGDAFTSIYDKALSLLGLSSDPDHPGKDQLQQVNQGDGTDRGSDWQSAAQDYYLSHGVGITSADSPDDAQGAAVASTGDGAAPSAAAQAPAATPQASAPANTPGTNDGPIEQVEVHGPPRNSPPVNILDNMREAQAHPVGLTVWLWDSARALSNMVWFYRQVKPKAPWDYKKVNPSYEDFGNYNFGATGVSADFPPDVLLRGAGAAQIGAGTSRPEWGTPWGAPPYGDDPNDQKWIIRGIDFGLDNRGNL